MPVFLKKFGAPAHNGPNFGMTQKTFAHLHRARIETLVEARVGGDRVDQRLSEQKIMDRVFGSARDRRCTLHHIGVTYSPFVSLLCAHRPANHQREFAQAEFFRE